MRIESSTNAKVKQWYKLKQKKYRDIEDLFIVEERHLIQEALKYDLVDSIIYLNDNEFEYEFDNCYQVTEEIMKKLSFNTSLNNYIAVCKKVELSPKSFERILILDNIQNPGNLGTIIRSARSFNFDAIYLSNDSVDLYNSKTIQATQGAFMGFPIIRTDIIDVITSLKRNGVKIIGTELESSVDIEELATDDKMAFIMGNEGNGVSEEVRDLCDSNVTIKISDFESLNVAIAASIIMYKFKRVK